MADFGMLFDMLGFDYTSTPPWQMVPVGGDRYVTLGDGKGLKVLSTQPSVVSVQEVNQRDLPKWDLPIPTFAGDRFFRLHGVSRGAASILASDGPREQARLDVNAKTLKEVRVAFNFVKDTGGVKTSHLPTEAAQWIRDLNKIYQQCNLRLICRASRWISVKADLGWVVSYVPQGTDEENREWNLVVANYDSSAEVNVFLFNDFRLGHPVEDNASGITLGKFSGLDDDASPYIKNMAHEIGHTQGLRDDALADDALMGWQKGVHLRRAEVNIVNP
jgi:hypothetical protein